MAQHKYAQTGLVAWTTSTTADVVKMAEACAASMQSDYFRGLGIVQISQRAADGLELVVMGGVANKFKHLIFTVTTSHEAERTFVKSRLSWFRTSQSTIFGFIPVGPKTMLGYGTYKLFMERLASTLREADRTADVQISATADAVSAQPAAS